jgi:formate dehydrogenase major subunit
MTNHWIDIRNSDVILIMGSNAAENHPVSFKWVSWAKDRGATLIHVDPRFTRTSAQADIYAHLRSGTDIAFLGGMIKYILENDLYHKDYVRLYTNGPFILNPDFQLTAELEGVFSGYDPQTRTYDQSSWAFEEEADGVIRKDPDMTHPRCVLQLLKRHYSRYDLDTVSSITGTPKEKLIKIYRTYAATGQANKVATIMYAMGWTQHTVGTQNIRTMAIIQLLLGNIGRAGGGVNALRGESNVQGSTDHCLLFHILPGYLKTPRASNTSLEAYNRAYTPRTGEPDSANWWSNYPKYSVSLLKAHYGESATRENEFGYQWLPKLDDGQNASWLILFDEMMKGAFQGFFAWGQNPACSGANSNKVRQALSKLDWLVNVNLFDNETGSFWRGPGMDPKEVQTEVFFLPCCSFVEKEGSITNSGRWAQWRYKAMEPRGQSRPDSEIINELQFRVKSLYENEGGAYPDPVVKLSWEYGPKDGQGKVTEMDTHLIAKEINGYFVKDTRIKGKLYTKGTLVPSFAFLQDDGSTSSGNWLYCNSYTEEGNKMARRSLEDPTGMGLYPEWSWCWPVNRRIIYNRASVDAYGRPWDIDRPVIRWNMDHWEGDVPDGGWPPLKRPNGEPYENTKKAFIMKPAGVASIFGPGRPDGPFPEYYEPLESPLAFNPIPRNSQRVNPVLPYFCEPLKEQARGIDVFAENDPRFPYVCTTYRVTEHWQSGVMTRHIPWLLELVPQLIVEMDTELAGRKGIRDGDRVKLESARGEVEAVAVVTNRLRPFTIMGETVHQVGTLWCFGWQFPAGGQAGDSANLLTATTGCPNTLIPETKAFMVNVRKV